MVGESTSNQVEQFCLGDPKERFGCNVYITKRYEGLADV